MHAAKKDPQEGYKTMDEGQVVCTLTLTLTLNPNPTLALILTLTI